MSIFYGNQEEQEIYKKYDELRQILTDSKKGKDIKDLLISYQPVSVTQYEIDHCVYTLENIRTIKKYLKNQAYIDITAFLPSNLPLYSLLLFVIMPSFISRSVVLRPNTALIEKCAIGELFNILRLKDICPNIEIFSGSRDEFLQNHVSRSDLIIFTGRNETKNKIKKCMKLNALMINNGSGHNPIVVTEDADVDKAIKGLVYSRFFNNGQDCAGPDAVFVHKEIRNKFIEKLKEKVSSLKVGDHSDPDTILGRIHRKEELERLHNVIESNKSKIILGGRVDMQSTTVHPTIVLSVIESGNLNYKEVFGPVLFLYTYQDDEQLQLYFEDKNGVYIQNKMYVSLFGTSPYIESRDDNNLVRENGSTKGKVGIVLNNKIIHDIIIDNGTVPYGGYSKGASSIIRKKEDKKFESIAIPILIPEVIYEIFIKGIKINDLVHRVKSEQVQKVINKKNLQETRRKISAEFIKLTKETFKDNLVFAFIFGSIASSTFQHNKSDMDTFVCLKKEEEKIRYFVSEVKVLHEKFNLKVDDDYPSEIVEYSTLIEEIYHLYYQLYGINYNPWLDNEKYDCRFLVKFECCSNKIYDIVFWSAIIATGAKIALIKKDNNSLRQLKEHAKDLIGSIIEEILQNIENIEAADLPKALKKEYPGCSGKEIASKLRELNFCKILLHTIDWPKTELIDVKVSSYGKKVASCSPF